VSKLIKQVNDEAGNRSTTRLQCPQLAEEASAAQGGKHAESEAKARRP